MSENFADDLIPGSEDGPMEEVHVDLPDVPVDEDDEIDEAVEVKPVTFGHEGADFRPKPDYGTTVPKDFSVRVSAS